MSDQNTSSTSVIAANDNEVEKGTRIYWFVSLAWRRGYKAEEWTVGDLIDVLQGLVIRRGHLGFFAGCLMEDVVHDRKVSTPVEINLAHK